VAVDYWHRLIITGPRETVDLFRAQLRRSARRSSAGRHWRETIPFSFDRLYQLVPAASRIEPELPREPYDVSAWPIQRLLRGDAEVRYQLHTRNIELLPFVRLLSKRFSALTFRLVTFCLDDSEVASYRASDGRVRKWILPQPRRDAHWERARQKFGLAGDDVYEHDDAERFAEESMLEEAMDRWEPATDGPHPRRRVRNWWNRPASREIMTELYLDLAELNARLPADEEARPGRTSKRGQVGPSS
jgi:hypothetical protein